MKTRTRILLTLGVMLIALLLFSTNNVKAITFTKFKAQVNDEIMAIVETGNITENSLDKLNNIKVNLKESECNKTAREIFNQIKTELEKQNITIKEIASLEEYKEFNESAPNEYVEINVSFMVSEINIYKANVNVMKYSNSESQTIIDKEVSITYNNTSKYNESDKKELEKKLSNLNLPKIKDEFDGNTYYQVIKYEEVGKGIGETSSHIFNYDTDIIKETINDNNITVLRRAGGMGGGTYLPFGVAHNAVEYLIFKNDILYATKKFCPSIPNGRQITVPNDVKNIEEYAIPKIESHIKEFFKKYDIGWKVEKVRIEKVKDNSYKVYATIEGTGETEMTADNIYLIIKQEGANPVENITTKEDKTTGIKIEGNFSSNIVISSNKVTDQTLLNKVAEVLKNVSSKYIVYDISLLENNTKVQPNGKIKVSIPIPSGYNTSKLVVYRVTENSEKIEYKPVINGNYVTFETDHFSTYVLAEQTTSNKPNTDNNKPTNTNTTSTDANNLHKKDDTPKTGTDNIALIASAIISIVSLAGIIIIKKK